MPVSACFSDVKVRILHFSLATGNFTVRHSSAFAVSFFVIATS